MSGLAIWRSGVLRKGAALSLGLSTDALLSLPDLLAKERLPERVPGRVPGRVLESAASSRGAAYTELSPEDASAMALGVGLRPTSPTARALWAGAMAGMAPELYGRLW